MIFIAINKKTRLCDAYSEGILDSQLEIMLKIKSNCKKHISQIFFVFSEFQRLLHIKPQYRGNVKGQRCKELSN